MAANFEEKSGLITTTTEWGNWGQTIEDVLIEINVKSGTSPKVIKCVFKHKEIYVSVDKNVILQGNLFGGIVKDEAVWTLEDKKLLRIILPKSHKDASNCWKSLFSTNEYAVDSYTFQEMEKKLTLERFQTENPGFDFSKAEVSGNFQGGGPQFYKR
ncbi:nudC domain-containing protein 2-like isoform X1 [Hydractinia symbiolongicarpus]|uniref:nudC domain-containing protein 2-like isoform X1 n=2 Tax=Hydractinia symbiolongicarpus TaxID=13093 RepID=UPI00254BE38C|nr:nudC domain-containing protein 2-like isoform X1 [Hydractinia symbiolongicarpus]